MSENLVYWPKATSLSKMSKAKLNEYKETLKSDTECEAHKKMACRGNCKFSKVKGTKTYARDVRYKDHHNKLRYICGTKQNKVAMIVHDLTKEYILLVKSYGGDWSFPKGSMSDFDESHRHSAIRELHEETGLIVNVDDLTLINDRINIKKIRTVASVYSFEMNKDDFDISQEIDLEISDIGWFKVSEIPEKLNAFTKYLGQALGMTEFSSKITKRSRGRK